MKEYHLSVDEYVNSVKNNGKYIIEDIAIIYHYNGDVHRENGPAIEYQLGERHWYINGKRHRLDGPACECLDGTFEYWINGKQYSLEEFEASIEYYLYKNGLENYK